MTDRLIALTALAVVVGAPISVALGWTSTFLLNFVFYYPLTMSALWISGGLYFWWRWERHWDWGPGHSVPELPDTPLITILVVSYQLRTVMNSTVNARR